MPPLIGASSSLTTSKRVIRRLVRTVVLLVSCSRTLTAVAFGRQCFTSNPSAEPKYLLARRPRLNDARRPAWMVGIAWLARCGRAAADGFTPQATLRAHEHWVAVHQNRLQGYIKLLAAPRGRASHRPSVVGAASFLCPREDGSSGDTHPIPIPAAVVRNQMLPCALRCGRPHGIASIQHGVRSSHWHSQPVLQLRWCARWDGLRRQREAPEAAFCYRDRAWCVDSGTIGRPSEASPLSCCCCLRRRATCPASMAACDRGFQGFRAIHIAQHLPDAAVAAVPSNEARATGPFLCGSRSAPL